MSYVTLKSSVLNSKEFNDAEDWQQQDIERMVAEEEDFFVEDEFLVYHDSVYIKVDLFDEDGVEFEFTLRRKYLYDPEDNRSAMEQRNNPLTLSGSVTISAPSVTLNRPFIMSEIHFSEPTIKETPNLIKESNMSQPIISKSVAYREIFTLAMDHQSKAVGIVTSAGLVTYDGSLKVNPISASFIPVPAMANRTELSDVKAMDFIVKDDGSVAFVTAPVDANGALSIIKTDGTNEVITPMTNTLLGTPAVLIVKNQFKGMAKLSTAGLLVATGHTPEAAIEKAGMLQACADNGILAAPDAE